MPIGVSNSGLMCLKTAAMSGEMAEIQCYQLCCMLRRILVSVAVLFAGLGLSGLFAFRNITGLIRLVCGRQQGLLQRAARDALRRMRHDITFNTGFDCISTYRHCNSLYYLLSLQLTENDENYYWILTVVR